MIRRNNREDNTIIQLTNLNKIYYGKVPFTALNNITLDFDRRKFYAIMGPSGSGKSTLLNCTAGLDYATRGSIKVDGIEISGLKEPKLTKVRRKKFGFVFQSYNLIDSLNVLDNIIIAQKLIGIKPNRKFIKYILGKVGLAGKEKSYPNQLSGGQKQRVAIARTLSNEMTEIIFADEPTGALDQKTGIEVLRLLREAVDNYEKTVIMVTHDPQAASWADEIIFIVDGKPRKSIKSPNVEEVANTMTRLEVKFNV